MQNLIDTAVSFPAVVFTVSTLIFLGFWIVTTFLGSGMDALDDFDLDFDADVELDGAGDAPGGLLRSSLEFLGITGMPILLSLNLLSIFGWAVSMIAMTVLGDLDGGTGLIIGLGVLIGAFLLGGFVTGRIARRFDKVFIPTPALRQGDLVGRVCTVTTGRVTAEFGQAEVRDAEGGSLVVQVRADMPNDIGNGDRVLIFDLDRDTGIFRVTADTELDM